MTCHEFQADRYLFLDGGLPASRRERAQRHLASCSACRTQAASIRRVEERVRTTLREHEPVPAGLWQRIRSGLVADADEVAMRPAGYRWRWWLLAATLLPAIAVGALLGRELIAPNALQIRLSESPIHELRTFVDSRRALDIATADPVRLRTWFADKVDFAPPLPAQVYGADLVGGRLCYLLEGRAAAYMYRADGRFVSLYVMERAGLEPPRDEPAWAAGRRVTVHTSGDYTHVLWQNGALLFSLVAALPRERLLEIAGALISVGPAAEESITPFSAGADPHI